MTIEEWQVSADPFAMLDFLFPVRGIHSTQDQPRKLRLYLCALARIAWTHLPAPMRATIRAAENLAESPDSSCPQLRAVREISIERLRFEGQADDLAEWERELQVQGYSAPSPERLPKWTAKQWHDYAVLVYLPFEENIPNFHGPPKPLHRADLVREIFEHPFSQNSFDTSWRSTAVFELAEGMYRARDFSPMPMLADALEDAGCDCAPILSHCRKASGTHVRGCWVVDRIVALEPKLLSRFVERFP